ncbi:MAG: xylulokinase [Ktedonobacterales bacterium]
MLGIDLGTSSAKVLVLDEQGRTLGVAAAPYEVVAPQPGWAESDPDAWWRATLAAAQSALAQASRAEITAIGLSGQMHGVVLTDQAGRPIRPALLWPDSRAEAELDRYQAVPVSMRTQLANPLVPGMAGPLLCWLADHEPEAYQAARWALQPKDWLRRLLTGAAAADPSDASATLLYDLPADCWADDVIAALGLRRDLFPPIAPSSSVAGTLTAQAAASLGLREGLPVAVGAADTAAGMLGTGLLAPGPIQLTLGTGAQVVQIRRDPTPDPTLRTHLYRAADGASWYAMAAVQNAGLALDWVRGTLGAGWDDVYASADAVAPGADGLTFLPYVTRERPHYQGPQRGGAFLGIRLNHTPAHMLRAALEGVAFGIRQALEALPGASAATVVRLVGGGSVHPTWRQMLADILGRELETIDMPAASARGAALLGGIAGGVWADAAATASVAPGAYVAATPHPTQAAAYDTAYARYLLLSGATDATT